MTNVPFDLDHAQMSDAGFEVVEFFEGWETEELDAAGNWTGYYIAYKKGKDPWTIGPGLTGKFRISGKPITVTIRALPMTSMSVRSHSPVMSRKPMTRAGLTISEMVRPRPKMMPQIKAAMADFMTGDAS